MMFRILLLLLILPCFVSAQEIGIIPLPNSFTRSEGSFHLDANSTISLNDRSVFESVRYFQKQALKSFKSGLPLAKSGNKAAIRVLLLKSPAKPGSYTLQVKKDHIQLMASDAEGIFHALVSLYQLMKFRGTVSPFELPLWEIHDEPRFAWRGFMLDEARHFFGKEKVEQLLDWMALYKLNRFHWHLSDAQGWRIEIKSYPRLTEVGAIGDYSDSSASARFYTQEEIKQIVAYAKTRFIEIIPEIDMPGHASAANRAYPEYSGGSIPKYENFTFDPSNEKVYAFLGIVVRELNTLFPYHMLHLGGDEVALGMKAWNTNEPIKKFMLTKKFDSLPQLEHYFFLRMADTVVKLKSKILCWDEAVESDLLPSGKTIVFWWRQNVPATLEKALTKNYQVVLCPRLPLYFDFVQDSLHSSGRKWHGKLYNAYQDIYNYPEQQTGASDLSSNLIIGIQANLWTETVKSEKRLDYMIFPRMAALAEAAWTSKGSKNIASFDQRLRKNLEWYKDDGLYYYDPFDPKLHAEPVDLPPRPQR